MQEATTSLHKTYWCHHCQVHFPSQDIDVRCSHCSRDFCEEVNDTDNPQAFVPFHLKKSKPRNLTKHIQQGFVVRQQRLQSVEVPLEAILQHLRSQSQEAPPASEEVIARLPRHVQETSQHQHHKECAICQEQSLGGEVIAKMPCGHEFHEQCVVTWLQSRNSCPQCRFQLKGNFNHSF